MNKQQIIETKLKNIVSQLNVFDFDSFKIIETYLVKQSLLKINSKYENVRHYYGRYEEDKSCYSEYWSYGPPNELDIRYLQGFFKSYAPYCFRENFLDLVIEDLDELEKQIEELKYVPKSD